jgi:sortase B
LITCLIIFAVLPMTYREEPKRAEVPEQTEVTGEVILEVEEDEGDLQPEMLPEMQELYEQNNDLAGWIKIDGTVVDYPVMYTPDDGEFYLYRTFEKEDDPTKQGCIFIDKNCSIDPRSDNLILHGHNMKNGTMFHTLIEYEDEEFYAEHKIIEYSTLYSRDNYEIVSVFLSKVYNKDETDVFKFYQFYNAETEEEWDEFISNIKSLELYETGVTPEYGDELITLSTCEYSQENGRIVIVARRVKDAA